MSEILLRHQKQVWSIPARIVDWVDGDTVDVIAEVLPYEWEVRRVRVAKINAPEDNTVDGRDAAKFASGALPRGTLVRLVSEHRENYARVLAEIRYGSPYGQEPNDFGRFMIVNGHAVLYGNKGVEFQP